MDLDEAAALRNCVSKLVEASKAQTILVDELTERVAQSDAAKQARQRRANASRAHIGTGGIVRKEEVTRIKRIKQDYDELLEKNRLAA
jgi:hypothetical protein